MNLTPCPLCGGQPKEFHRPQTRLDDEYWEFSCESDHPEISGDSVHSRQDAIDNWEETVKSVEV